MSGAIKFRAWDKDVKKFADMCAIHIDGDIMASSQTFGGLYDFVSDEMAERIVLQQYTGLKDRNGVEIYEGDILAVAHQKYLSVGDERFYKNGYDNRLVKWRVTSHHNGWNIYNAPQTQFEVIGNIYESPGLLTNKGER